MEDKKLASWQPVKNRGKEAEDKEIVFLEGRNEAFTETLPGKATE